MCGVLWCEVGHGDAIWCVVYDCVVWHCSVLCYSILYCMYGMYAYNHKHCCLWCMVLYCNWLYCIGLGCIIYLSRMMCVCCIMCRCVVVYGGVLCCEV